MYGATRRSELTHLEGYITSPSKMLAPLSRGGPFITKEALMTGNWQGNHTNAKAEEMTPLEGYITSPSKMLASLSRCGPFITKEALMTGSRQGNHTNAKAEEMLPSIA
jgi:hypothetical protein